MISNKDRASRVRSQPRVVVVSLVAGLRGNRRRAVTSALTIGTLLLVSVLMAGAAHGTTTIDSVRLVSSSSSGIPVSTIDYSAAKQALTNASVPSAEETSTTATIVVPNIPGFTSDPLGVGLAPATVAFDDANHSLTISGGLEGGLFPGSMVATSTQAFLSVDWADGTSTSPNYFIGFRIDGKKLKEFNPKWTGDADNLAFVEATALLAPSEFTVGSSTLPDVNSLMNLGGPTSLRLVQGLGFAAQINTASFPDIGDVGQLLGVNSGTVRVAGTVSSSAAHLFEPQTSVTPTTDDDALSLDVIFPGCDGTCSPSWIKKLQDLKVHLQIGDTTTSVPKFRVTADVTITIGGKDNLFHLDTGLIDLSELKKPQGTGLPAKYQIDLALHSSQSGGLQYPFKLSWLALNDIKLHLELVRATGAFEASIDGKVTLQNAGPATLHIDVAHAGGLGNGTVRFEGNVGLDDVVTWLKGTNHFNSPSSQLSAFATTALQGVTLKGAEFSYDDVTTQQRRLTLFASSTVGWKGMNALNAKFLLSLTFDGAVTEGTQVVAAFQLTGSDGTACTLKLGDIFPKAATSIADVELPTVNLAWAQPATTISSTSGLSPAAASFLQQVRTASACNGSGGSTPGTIDPIEISDKLHFSSRVDLSKLPPVVRDTLGLASTGLATIEGDVDVDFKAFANSCAAQPGQPCANTSFDPEVSIGDFQLEGSLPVTNPSWGPSWVGVNGAWQLGVDWKRDAKAFSLDATSPKVSIAVPNSGQTFTDVQFVMSATKDANGVSASVKGSLGAWDKPFNISWLSLKDASVDVKVTSGQTTSFAVGLAGTAEIGTEPNVKTITATIDVSSSSTACGSNTSPSAELTLKMGSTITAQDVFSLLNYTPPSNTPASFLSAGFGPAEAEVLACGGTPANVKFAATGTASFQPFSNSPRIGISGLVYGSFGATTDLVIGVRPTVVATQGGTCDFSSPTYDAAQCRGIKLGDLLPGVTIPSQLDLELFDPSATQSDKEGFGFLFSTKQMGADDLPKIARDWLDPLYGFSPGSTEDFTVKQGFGPQGAFKIPPPVGGDQGFLQSVGMSDTVIANGTFPLPADGNFANASLDLTLSVSLKGANLPPFLDGGGMNMAMKFAAGPSLALSLGGNLDLAIPQGTIGSVPAPFDLFPQASAPVNGQCPRGGKPKTVNGSQYCFDIVRVSLDGKVTLQNASIEASVVSQLTSLGTTWAPFGFTDVQIGGLGGKVGIKFDATGTEIVLGFQGSMNVLGKGVSGAVKVSIKPLPNPPFVVIKPLGLRFDAPGGLSLKDITDVYKTITGKTLPTGQLPVSDLSVRNLGFEAAVESDTDLCLHAGFRVSGDLYVDAPPGSAPSWTPKCNTSTGNIVADTTGSAPQKPDCETNDVNGCFAGIDLKVDANGLDGKAFLNAFDVGAFHWSAAVLELKLQLLEQRFRLSGGARLGPVSDPVAEGAVSINFTSALSGIHANFAAKLGLFPKKTGFTALATGGADLDPIQLLTNGNLGNLDLHLALASKHSSSTLGDVSSLDFPVKLNEKVTNLLGQLQSAVQKINDIVAKMSTDPKVAIKQLRDFLSGYGVVIPQWSADALTTITTVASHASKRGQDLLLDWMLNGVGFSGIDGTFVSCAGVRAGGVCGGISFDPPKCVTTVVNGKCYLIPPVQLPGICDLFTNVSAFSDGCTVQEFVDHVLVVQFKAGLNTILQGVGANYEQVRSLLANPGTLFGVDCASFDMRLNLSPTGTGSVSNQYAFGLDTHLLGTPLSMGFSWDFGQGVLPNARNLVKSLFNPTSATCTDLDLQAYAAGGGTVAATALPPVVSASVDNAAVNEGRSVNLAVAFDKTLTGPRPVTINWGDGTTTTMETAASGSTGFSKSHTYADDAPSTTTQDAYTITVTDTSSDGSSDTETVTVKNVDPSGVSAALSNSSVNEGGSATLTVSFTDPGTPDTHTVSVNWGDGTSSTIPLAAGVLTASPSHTYADDDPSATASDTANIQVTVDDDDSGRGTASTSLTVNNVAPTLTAQGFTPTNVDEGDEVDYTVSFSDPGTLDTHIVRIDWNGDGEFEHYESLAAGQTTFTVTAMFNDDDPQTGTPYDDFPARVEVTDDDMGTTNRDYTIRVSNVDPDVSISLDDSQIDENGTVTVSGTFTDPGLPDSHTVHIDWGDDEVAATDLTLDVGDRTFGASATYGDNGDYDITATVTDDDTGSDADIQTVTVDNVDPTVEIDESEAVALDGGATLLGRREVPLAVAADLVDPGSDDLTLTWTWDTTNGFGILTTSNGSLVNDPATDPALSPTVQPRDVTLSNQHTYPQACLYRIQADATDDDAGAAVPDNVWTVIQGDAALARGAGWWYNVYQSKDNANWIDPTTLDCYLKIAGHSSRVFTTSSAADDDPLVIATTTDAVGHLNKSGSREAREILGRQLLTIWLNFANGPFTWNVLVDADGKRGPETPFSQVVKTAEDVYLDEAATRSQLLVQYDIVKNANGGV